MASDLGEIITMSKEATGKCDSALERLLLIFFQVDRHTHIDANVAVGEIPGIKNKLGDQCSGFLLR
jgi:hypothetical protein